MNASTAPSLPRRARCAHGRRAGASPFITQGVRTPCTTLCPAKHTCPPSLTARCFAVPTPVRDVAVESFEAPSRRRSARSPQDLNDPAKIGAKGQANVQVTAHPGDVSLEAYMTLPVEQYFVLDPKQIRHLGANRFLLLVPRINILNVWLEPEVDISVTTQASGSGAPKVVLQAENCRIRGCNVIESLRLDQRFCMRFTTELTWNTRPDTPSSSASSSMPIMFPLGSAASGSGSSWDEVPMVSPPAPAARGMGTGTISGDAALEVWCEVIPPFNIMPREVLQSSCNAVMHGLVNTLLPMFLRNLGSDYAKWATQPDYRIERAKRSNPLV